MCGCESTPLPAIDVLMHPGQTRTVIKDAQRRHPESMAGNCIDPSSLCRPRPGHPRTLRCQRLEIISLMEKH